MKKNWPIQALKESCFNADTFPPEVLSWIAKENLWNLWVPKAYGGLEMSFTEGLHTLRELARIDGSLGWTITLCSGANYFIGNLQKEVSQEIFGQGDNQVCFGGSGGIFGTAEKQGSSYKIKGRWRYATGAPYLTHFTLNARILEEGKEILQEDGSPLVRSFLVPREEVQILEDWNTMGLKATATHSFEVQEVLVAERYSFVYNQLQLPHSIFKIHFSVFADLTLWMNYLGMIDHFLAEAQAILPEEKLRQLEQRISHSTRAMKHISEEIESKIAGTLSFSETYIAKIHQEAAASVRSLTQAIIEVYPLLGIRASSTNHLLNQIFRDYFTATQHHIFVRDR